ncbi:hypothetical protein [Amycolatopsis sp. NPDC054798]
MAGDVESAVELIVQVFEAGLVLGQLCVGVAELDRQALHLPLEQNLRGWHRGTAPTGVLTLLFGVLDAATSAPFLDVGHRLEPDELSAHTGSNPFRLLCFELEAPVDVLDTHFDSSDRYSLALAVVTLAVPPEAHEVVVGAAAAVVAAEEQPGAVAAAVDRALEVVGHAPWTSPRRSYEP